MSSLRSKFRAREAAVCLLALALLTDCNRKTADALDDEALQAINLQVAQALNEPGASILQLIKALDKPTPIGLEAMQVTLDQQATPVDVWLYGHGFVTLIQPQADPGHPTFLIAPTGRQLAQGSPDWFTAAGAPGEVDCSSTAAQEAQGCLVEVSVTPGHTEAGAPVIGQAPLPTLKVHAVVAQSGEGWQVKDLRADNGTLHDYVFRVLMGDEKTREAARTAMMTNLTMREGMASDIQVPSAFAAGPASDLDAAPVHPELGDNPLAPPPRGGPALRPQGGPTGPSVP
jgi:hypothetical protein